MNKFKWLVIVALFLIAEQPSSADDRAKLLGVWNLISIVGEFQDTGEKSYDWGKNPTGYTIYTPEGRMMSIIESEGRKAPMTDDDRATLFKTMFAFTGMYRIEGDKLISKIDVSWNPAVNGTEFVRSFKFEGDRLLVSTSWGPSTRFPGRVTRGVFTWERMK